MATTTSATNAGITTGLKTDTSATTANNPGAVLDKDSFMKLLLVELQHQDPTAPMDSDKILTQTSQLATLESASNTNKALEDLATQLSASRDFAAISTIGKMASLGSNAITLEKGKTAKFEVYFEKEIKDGTLSITDKKGNVVRKVSLADQAGKSGVLAFEWDGADSSGTPLASDYYSVKAEYLDKDNTSQSTQFGIYPVESVRYEDGSPLIKLGSSYVPMSYIVEFF
ncbi:MAG: flagellar hook capping FlgD N-terminal domain-containing protein [Sulfurospirillaceae bacterium]|nr:flagellar hook capping FlgD N-terminal domain-containing protein [Sulfurospirillaceae bacterium]MDD2825294.1 flagellar hook capping FlgD N-terminal domain-containing protein [Sulfurospirillaceae bacterium]